MSNPPVYFRSKKNQAKKELTQYFYNNTVYSYCAKQFRVCEHLLHTPQRSCDVVIINKTNTKHYTAVCHAECITNDKITTKVCKHKHDIKTENKQGARTDLNKTKCSRNLLHIIFFCIILSYYLIYSLLSFLSLPSHFHSDFVPLFYYHFVCQLFLFHSLSFVRTY